MIALIIVITARDRGHWPDTHDNIIIILYYIVRIGIICSHSSIAAGQQVTEHNVRHIGIRLWYRQVILTIFPIHV